MERGADKGDTDHKEREVDAPNGRTFCVSKETLDGWEGVLKRLWVVGLAWLWKDYLVCSSHGREKIRYILVWKGVGFSVGLDCMQGLSRFGEWRQLQH